MKKLVFMFLLALPIYASAVSTDTLNAVAMVAYDQSWDDWKGTLALRKQHRCSDKQRDVSDYISRYER